MSQRSDLRSHGHRFVNKIKEGTKDVLTDRLSGLHKLLDFPSCITASIFRHYAFSEMFLTSSNATSGGAKISLPA